MTGRILRRVQLTADTFEWEVEADALARAAHPGQFVMVRLHGGSERIPLTLADFDTARGVVTLVVLAAGKSTREMMAAPEGTTLQSLAGPLGMPSEIPAVERVTLVGGGLGVAPLYPQVKAFRAAGARVTAVVGFRSRARVFWEDRFAAAGDELIVVTEDGTRGERGRVTDVLARRIADSSCGERVVAIGPLAMMRACAELTRAVAVPTIVSLNPIMVDGTGMCGSCRVLVGGRMRFACVEGPEFDGHAVDFADLALRQPRFRAEERRARAVEESCRLVAAADRSEQSG
ncbi:MAG: sulfide/dihydroorotate dehydrogenase-like FAD/NAD-binding protein [Deltaproteobacteria bacterium]|nr:sulfide/dihydroorotate dehydrogenase-like FAD/NAD-binding protein [Deltaproteobacteria bacterium]